MGALGGSLGALRGVLGSSGDPWVPLGGPLGFLGCPWGPLWALGESVGGPREVCGIPVCSNTHTHIFRKLFDDFLGGPDH